MGRHTRDDREAALERLRASAAERGGPPAFAALARELGVPDTTLRRWWKAREQRKGELRVLHPDGPPGQVVEADDGQLVDEQTNAIPDPLSTPPSAFWKWMFDETVRDIRDARADRAAPYVIAKMRPELGDYYERARLAYEAEKVAGRGNLSPEERRQKLRQAVRSASPSDAVVMIEELEARKMIPPGGGKKKAKS